MKRVSFNGTVVLLRYVSLFPSFNPILPSFTEFSWIVANFSNLSRRLRTWTNSFLIFPNFTQNLSWCWRVWPTIMKCYLILLNLTYFTSLIWFSLPTLSETPDSFTRFSLHPFALAVEVFSYWWPQIWRCWIGPNDQHLFLPFGHGFFLRISNGAVVFAFFAVPGAGYVSFRYVFTSRSRVGFALLDGRGAFGLPTRSSGSESTCFPPGMRVFILVPETLASLGFLRRVYWHVATSAT